MDNKTNTPSESGVFRRKRKNFSMVSNAAMRDDTLSLSAKGLYALIQSYLDFDGFVLHKWFLQSKCVEKEHAFNSAWKALQEKGYLRVYKFRNPGERYYRYEYELLDEPDAEVVAEYHRRKTNNNGQIDIHGGENQPPDFQPLENQPLENQPLENQPLYKYRDNNTEYKNTVINHTISEVHSQIHYPDFEVMRPDAIAQLDEIVLLIQEVFNMPDGQTVRINKREMDSVYVKERFHMLTFQHIDFVLDLLDAGYSEVRNTRNYLLTLLYNAPTMASNSIASKASYDLKNGVY